MVERIDLETASKIHQVLITCRSRGGNPVEILDRARMLRHMGTRREDAVMTLTIILEMIRSLAAGHEVKTPMDMKNLIIAKLEEKKNDIAAQH